MKKFTCACLCRHDRQSEFSLRRPAALVTSRWSADRKWCAGYCRRLPVSCRKCRENETEWSRDQQVRARRTTSARCRRLRCSWRASCTAVRWRLPPEGKATLLARRPTWSASPAASSRRRRSAAHRRHVRLMLQAEPSVCSRQHRFITDFAAAETYKR